jgi:hypothetical protein
MLLQAFLQGLNGLLDFAFLIAGNCSRQLRNIVAQLRERFPNCWGLRQLDIFRLVDFLALIFMV